MKYSGIVIFKRKILNFHLNLPNDVISGVLVVLEVPKVVMVCSGDVMVANVVDLAVVSLGSCVPLKIEK